MLRRNFVLDPYEKVDTYVCGLLQEEYEKKDKSEKIYERDGIDPFLLKVLKAKRGESKLTDIIASIQENQNAMIRHDYKKNMIVQGCAGSGKTMILLHRISYLKYNNLLRSLKRTVMIIPNIQFHLFIDDISTNLEIKEMPQYTMSQYYLELIERYQRQIYIDMLQNDRPLIQEILILKEKEFVRNNILDSREIFENILENEICDFYDSKMSEFLSDIHADKIIKLAEEFDIEILNEKSNAQKLNYLSMYLEKILKILNNATKNEWKALRDVRKIFTNYKIFTRHIEKVIDNLKELMTEYHMTKSESFYALLQKICPQKSKVEKCNTLKKEAETLNAKIKSETSGFLRFETDEEDRVRLELLYDQINTLERQISENELEGAPENILQLSKEIKALKQWREDNDSIVEKLKNVLVLYDRVMDQVLHEDIPFSEILLKFDEIQRAFNNSQKMQQIKCQLENANNNYITACGRVLSMENQKLVNYAYKKLENRAAIVKDIFEMFSGVKFTDINNARQLFVILAMYLLHVGKINIDCDFIFIDEAQDYSDIEYRLLRAVHGKNTIMELYGDCMQKIAPNRGIDNWNQVKRLFGNEYYELRENYRNTIEIANYINNAIKNIFVPIGLHGKRVYKLGSGWWHIVKGELKENSKKRIAVICKNTMRDTIEYFVAKKYVYTVEEAKGLEFDSVYVIETGMTDNEKYIACSRALKVLNIVSESKNVIDKKEYTNGNRETEKNGKVDLEGLELFLCNTENVAGRRVNVKCVIRNKEYILLKGSTVALQATSSCKERDLEKRQELQGVIDQQGKVLKDIPFKSPSALAQFALLCSVNGKILLKDRAGRLLKELL